MADPYFSDERDEPALDRLAGHGLSLLYETLLNDRRPVAVIGSGLSVVYGGVSWSHSVERVRDYTIERLKRCMDEFDKQPHAPSDLKAQFQIDLEALTAFREDGALDTSSDKYVALDLCSAALDGIDKAGDDYRGTCELTEKRPKGLSSFRAYMGRIYRDDTFFIQNLLIARFGAATEQGLSETDPALRDEKRELRRRIHKLDPKEVQQLACHFYSKPFLWEIVPEQSPKRSLFEEIVRDIEDKLEEMGFAYTDALPIDRRSLLCLALADVDEAKRRDYLRRALKAVEDAREPGNPAVQWDWAPPRPILDPIRRLQQSLRVRRFVTLNFDYLLEQSFVFSDRRMTQPRPYGIEEAIADHTLVADGEAGGLTRRFADGHSASTDLYDEKAVGRLFEFALDSADYRAQILHLHGRADKPDSMILTDTDNNRQYRRNRSARTALEQALDVTLTGNPILFVGIGLSEAEITRALRDLVSRGQATAHNPAFAIMEVTDGHSKPWRQQMAFYRQYGIHLIHAGLPDKEWCGLVECFNAINCVEAVVKGGSKAPAAQKLLEESSELWAEMFAKLPGELCGDNKAMSALLREAAGGAPGDAAARECWLDYLDKLKAKLRTFATIQTLKRISHEARKYALDRRIPNRLRRDGETAADAGVEPEDYDSSDDALQFRLSPRITDGQWDRRTLSSGFRVRDSLIWKAAREPASLNSWRHQPLLPSGGRTKPGNQAAIDDAVDRITRAKTPFVTCFSSLGAGKGMMLSQLHDHYVRTERPSLTVNCNFGLEFDSALSQILNFVWRHTQPDGSQVRPPKRARSRNIDAALRRGVPLASRQQVRPVMVLAGIERLVDRNGCPLAPELDLLLSVLLTESFATSGFQLVLIAADGCRDYLEKRLEPWLPIDRVDFDESESEALRRGFLGHLYATAMAAADRLKLPEQQELKNLLAYAASRSSHASVRNSARSLALTEVLRVTLDNWHQLAFVPENGGGQNAWLTRANRLRAELDERMLRALACIGLPIETGALDHLNSPGGLIEQIWLAERKSEPFDTVRNDEREKAIDRLAKFGLLMRIAPYPHNNDQRVALHRSAMAEVRERIGVRSGEELLSNGFNLTLALSMPTDLIVAEEDVQRELKWTVGRLRGSWRDTPLTPKTEEAVATLRNCASLAAAMQGKGVGKFDARTLEIHGWISELERAMKLVGTDMQANIRAAAGLIRSIFSAAALVAHMPKEMTRPDGQLGEFEEHKRRLGHIVNRFREAQRAPKRVKYLLEQIKSRIEKPELAAELGTAADTICTELKERKRTKELTDHPALYGGELVWLLNERSVIALLQGDLYEAQRGFREADEANSFFRIAGPSLIKRRIEINRTLVRIERGHITEARARLADLERESAQLAASSDWEHKMIRPLIHSYVGLCDHLGGHYENAAKRFDKAIRGLVKTGQQRALSAAYIRRASLHFGLGEKEAGNKMIELGMAAAETGRQMDLLWRARLTSVRGRNQLTDRDEVTTIFHDARKYAHVMDCPRVAIQALRGEAEFNLELGNIEVAGMLAAEAMTIAVRYGMVLQRIALRVLMGKILLMRNNSSGDYLLQRAIAHADRIGYQLQLDHAQRALLSTRPRIRR